LAQEEGYTGRTILCLADIQARHRHWLFGMSEGAQHSGSYADLSFSEGAQPHVLATPRTAASARSLASISTEDVSMLALSNVRRSPRWTFKQRRDPMGSQKDLHLPTALSYDPVYPEATSKMSKSPGFRFSSTATGRLELDRERVPGPGAYGAPTTGATRRRSRSSSPASERTALKTLRHSAALGFGSGSSSRPISPRMTPRTSPNNSTLLEELLDGGELMMGPGYYKVRDTMGGGPHYTINPRREPPRDEVPGPGTYEQVSATAPTSMSSQWGSYKCSQRPSVERSRKQTLSAVDAPGPGEYHRPRRDTSIGKGRTYTFRTRPKESVNNQVPGPGAYIGCWTQFR